MDTIFETAHLRIRKFRPEDAQPLYRIHGEAEVAKWIPNERYESPVEAEGAIRFYTDCVERSRLPYVLAVELKETGDLIGDTGANAVEGKPGEVELGYVICSSHRGKGYATELVCAMSGFLHSAFGVRVLYGRVIKGNTPSERVLQKNGFTFVYEESGAADDPYGCGMLVYQKDFPSKT